MARAEERLNGEKNRLPLRVASFRYSSTANRLFPSTTAAAGLPARTLPAARVSASSEAIAVRFMAPSDEDQGAHGPPAGAGGNAPARAGGQPRQPRASSKSAISVPDGPMPGRRLIPAR